MGNLLRKPSKKSTPKEPVVASNTPTAEAAKVEKVVPVVTAPQVEVVVPVATTTPQVGKVAVQEKSEPVNDTELGSYHLPSKLHKHVIGSGGKIIKEIQTTNNVKIELLADIDKVKITCDGQDEKKIKSAFKQIEETLAQVGWFYESGVWIEKLAYDEIFSKWNKKIEFEAESMKKCFEDSKASYDSGNKEEAKTQSTAGKVHQENMHRYKKECAKEVFDFLNAKFDDYTIDLHGQLVNEALEFVTQRVEKLAGNAKQPLQIITGAGNHSDASGAKIKPAVIKYLNEKSLKFEEINNGTLNVTL
ncbi:hypothetical protein AKO1_012051 [Acrasis kona]|uniref:Smr domain-containing protein n=1 Tax=Acrasis kona TaxID=1008807 RepID=A0AAW2ZAY8_9EUKA